MRPSLSPLRMNLAVVQLAGSIGIALGGCASDNTIIKMEGDDVFYQVEAGEVDVLLVVDNSGSMQPYQEELASNFAAFLTYFEEGNVDYHIGVVTTSVEAPEYFAGSGCTEEDIAAVPAGGALAGDTWITPATTGGDELFQELVSVGTCGNGYEMGLETAYLALTGAATEGFLREDAYLSVIFVSDEEDSSPMTTDDYINAYRDVKGQRERDVFNASSLVVTSLEECSARQISSGANPGTRYLDVAEQTEGVIGSICQDDFNQIVQELSLASSRLTDTFYLSELPDVTTLEVGVDGELIPCDAGIWRYDRLQYQGEERGAIIFERDALPAPQAQINVRYLFGGGEPADFCTASE